LGSIETHHIPLSTKENINKGFQLAMNHPFMIFHNKIVHDIAGHTLKYNEIGGDYLAAKTYDFLKYTLILHAVVSVLLILLFLLFISKKIKHQLHIMEVMTDVIFSVPLAVYDSNSKLKKYVIFYNYIYYYYNLLKKKKKKKKKKYIYIYIYIFTNYYVYY